MISLTLKTFARGLLFSILVITKNIYQASVSTISASIKNNVKKFVFCSSMARYGSQTFPFTEDMIPNEYYIDIKVTSNQSVNIYKRVTTFQVVNQI